MKAGNDVELDLRPALAEGIHRRHQPIETGVALHRNAQLPGRALAQTGDIALGRCNLRQQGFGQLR